jgi:hypothetical protein
MTDNITSNTKIWLNDFLVHTTTEDTLLATLTFFFKQCQNNRLKLHASKCVLFATMVRYCGKKVTKDVVRFNSKSIKALYTTREPQNGTDLGQYVAAVRWIGSTCYALLRMRPLSIPCAECSVVISCGKVDYDKSG